MAHNLSETKGKPAMMYTGEKPWHGLGTKLEKAATAAEAIAAAGLDWRVTKEPIYLKDGRMIPGRYATVREDNRSILGSVGEVYRPLQNKEAFSFFDAVVGSKEAIYHTAGALGQGERVWILAKLPGEIVVTKQDVTEKYLLLTNTHDASSAVAMLFTPIRVVCQNTLNVALEAGAERQTVRHTVNMGLKVADVAHGLGIVHQRFEAFGEAARAMTGAKMGGEAWREFLRGCGIIPADEAKALTTRTQNIVNEIGALFEKGRGNDLPGVKHTAWGAFNAVAEYVDYARSSKGDKEEGRATSLLFGSGAKLKQRAWDTAFDLVGGKLKG